MYDYLIVGCGLYGAVFAQQAIAKGKRVKIVDKRAHIGGNIYTEKVNGITHHVYGPHIFHTNLPHVWEYISQFTQFNHYVNRPKVRHKDALYSFPINLMTLYQLWGTKTPKEAEAKLNSVRIPIENPKNLEEWVLSQVGEEIYELFIKGYTQKQWQCPPSELPTFIIKRLPIRLNFDDNYFTDPYQGIPIDGYTAMIEKMIQGADIALSTDYLKHRDILDMSTEMTIYTGRIDEYYNFQFGELAYRTLRFDTQLLTEKDFQGNAVINYTSAEVPYTRITEHKHFEFGTTESTLVTWEYPDDWAPDKIPYYPINTDHNQHIYLHYSEIAKHETRVRFGGRLGRYRYYDMDKIIDSALTDARELL